MKALAYLKYGSPDELSIINLPAPIQGNNEILVRVQFAGVNPVDWKIGEGRMRKYYTPKFPLIVGRDVAGTVVAIGKEVTKFSVGDVVFACLPGPGGAFAEYVTIDETIAALAPNSDVLSNLASFPLVGLTCWQALVEHAGIKNGETVFVLSGAGGTGSIALQLARAKGAFVLTTCSPGNNAYVENLGAAEVYNYSNSKVSDEILQKHPDGVDVVFSNVLSPLHRQSYHTLRKGGKLVTIGEAPIEGLADEMNIQEIDMVVRPDGDQLSQLAKMIETGEIHPPEIAVFKLSDGAQAFKKSMQAHTRGKLVLQVG